MGGIPHAALPLGEWDALRAETRPARDPVHPRAPKPERSVVPPSHQTAAEVTRRRGSFPGGVVLDSVVKNGVSADSLKRAKNKTDADLIYALDSQSTLARIFGTALTTGVDLPKLLAYPQTLQLVTADEVKAAAIKVLDLRRSVTGILLPEGGGAAGAQAPPPAPVTGGTVN